MKRIMQRAAKSKKQNKKHFSFLRALRLFEGMPLLGIRR